MNEKLLIDADVLIYRIAAACETRSILVTHTPTARTKVFKTRTEFKDWLKLNPKWDATEFTIEDKQEAEPVEFACSTVKKSITNMQEDTGIDSFQLYLSGDTNFRLDLPLPTRYKSNRQDSLRPLLLKELREFVIRKYKPIISDGCEADDDLARDCYQAHKRGWKWVAVTADKDQKQVHGWIYNPYSESEKAKGVYLIPEVGSLWRNEKGEVKGEGLAWLAFQHIMGDATDNYCPSDLIRLSNPKWKFGEVAAYNVLKDCKAREDYGEAVWFWYATMFPEPVTYTAWNGEVVTKDYREIYQLYYDCAYMRVGDNDEK